MAGISSKALKTNYAENKKKFVSQELDDDLGLNWYQFRFRNHDPQIGRFLQIDPLADEYEYNSTYAYAEDRPTTGIDLEGLEFFDLLKEVFWNNGIVPVVNFFNENLNPIVPAAELVTGKSYHSEFTEDKSRIESTGELMMTVIPAGKVEGTAAKSLEKAVVKQEVKQVEKQIVKSADQNLAKAEERAARFSEVDRSGKDFTKAGKDATKDVNKAKNGGQMQCESCGQSVQKAAKHSKGVTPASNEAHVDHITPKAKGGSGTPRNGQVLCRGCNLEKGAN